MRFEANGNIAYVYIYWLWRSLSFWCMYSISWNLFYCKIFFAYRLEVGLRQSNGEDKSNLSSTVLWANLLLLTTISIAVHSFRLFSSFLRFSILLKKQLSLKYLSKSRVLMGIFGLILTLGLISGSYPALFYLVFHWKVHSKEHLSWEKPFREI